MQFSNKEDMIPTFYAEGNKYSHILHKIFIFKFFYIFYAEIAETDAAAMQIGKPAEDEEKYNNYDLIPTDSEKPEGSETGRYDPSVTQKLKSTKNQDNSDLDESDEPELSGKVLTIP